MPWRRLAIAAAAVAAAVASLDPRFSPPAEYNVDKLVHMAAYAVPALAASLLAGGLERVLMWCGGLALFGAVMECAQALVPGRSPSVRDALANLAGIAAGFLLAVLLRRWAERGGAGARPAFTKFRR